MKSFFYLIICLLIGLIFLTQCNEKSAPINKNFVSIKDNKFFVNDSLYFPIMLNYVICIREIDKTPVVSSLKQYENPDIYEANNLIENETQLRGHLQLIKDMGFNSIRLVFDRMGTDSIGFYYGEDKRYYINNDYESILNAMENYLKIVSEYDLKVMFLIRRPVENKDLENFTIKILTRFKDITTIFAYDFFNEPLYFDNIDKPSGKMFREKKDAIEIVENWAKMIDKYAPNQLLTIGFSEPLEVFEWDPSVLPVDFIAFHTYNPLRVPNEIYWYSKYTNKPWMIGETALPADNDSIPYEHQQLFMREVYQRIIDCNGAGLGWWEFQELNYSHFEAKYTGLLNHEAITTTKDGKYKIIGTVKPAVKEIENFIKYKKKDCDCKSNYYNMIGYKNIVLTGKIINETTNKPVEGAVIRGWNESWSVGQNTFSDKDGNFTLYSNDICTHFEISAPGMTNTKFDKKVEYTPTSSHNIKIENLPNKDLEYHKISYMPFLLNKVENQDSITNIQNYIFNFEKSLFSKSLFKGDLGVQKLMKINN